MSVAVQVTVVEPRAKIDDDGFGRTVPMVQLSVAAGAESATFAVQRPASVFTDTGDGAAVNCGARWSATMMNCRAVAELPFTSVTVHVTVVAPIGSCAGALFDVDETPQLSANVALPKARVE